jgi:DeoR/GlpR family transcriptional regulator of sugar metabolism
MLDSSATKILLADHTKFHKRALHAVADLTEFDVVIVDWQTSKEDRNRLKSKGINVVVAPRPLNQDRT